MNPLKQAITKVGSRQFRKGLSTFLKASDPVAITSHGEIVGYYVPARLNKSDSEPTGLIMAAAQLNTLVASARAEREGELEKGVRRLTGGRAPETELIQYLRDLIDSENVSQESIINRLQQLEGRVLSSAEIKARLMLGTRARLG